MKPYIQATLLTLTFFVCKDYTPVVPPIIPIPEAPTVTETASTPSAPVSGGGSSNSSSNCLQYFPWGGITPCYTEIQKFIGKPAPAPKPVSEPVIYHMKG